MNTHREALIDELYKTRKDFWNIHPDSAELLKKIIAEKKPKKILEIGTSNGLGAIIMGSEAERYGGSITSLEFYEKRATLARENIQKAALQNTVTVVVGDAKEVIPTMEGLFDLVFLDAGKEDYIAYYHLLKEKLSSSAVLVADNTVSHRKKMTDFIEAVSNDTDFTVEDLSIGEGLIVASKK